MHSEKPTVEQVTLWSPKAFLQGQPIANSQEAPPETPPAPVTLKAKAMAATSQPGTEYWLP
jgi:hypothetical protein